jgi:hypothetical protein
MNSANTDSAWSQKGATLSDKSARREFGLTQEEIIEAIRDGKLQFRNANIYGNPYFRLLRSEIETLVGEIYGGKYVEKKKAKKELTLVERQLRALKAQVVSLERRKVELEEWLDES